MRRRAFLGASSTALAGLAGCLGGETEYTIADVSVPEQSGPLVLDVTVADASVTIDSPGRLTVTLRNESDERVRVRNTGVWPLGVLGLDPPQDSGATKTLLVTQQYDETGRVEVTSRKTSVSHDRPIVRPLEGGASVSEPYELHGDRLSVTGTYTLRGYFEAVPLEYRRADDDAWSDLHPDVSITATERSPLP